MRSPTSPARWLALTLGLLAACVAAAAAFGPFVLGLLDYRTSATTENQLLGSDAAALLVAAPLTALAALLVVRRHAAGAPLATGVAVYALYTYTQVVIGQEYLRLPGNVERFFPLLLAVFVLAEATLVLAWHALPAEPPRLSRRLERATGTVLVLVAVFLVVGLHLPTAVTAWTDPGSMTEYASAPTPFWMVKLMDLGIVVPVALVTGAGLLRGAPAVRRVLYPLLTGYTLLAVSVTSMALMMLAHDDPDASVGLAAGFGVFTVLLTVLVVAVYRPLVGRPDPQPSPEPSTSARSSESPPTVRT